MILGILALVFLALKVSGLTNFRSTGSYTVTADFDNIGSLKIRAPVSIAGVKIGEVSAIDLDPETFRAKVILKINENTNKLPIDTSASIFTQGLLGANYISLTPGYGESFLHEGDKIESTSPALILEKLIGQLVFSLKNNSDKSDKENKTEKKEAL
jgi:phospholipid/cholesterol/gamma-HCH transport system substrate-binding protein